MALVLNSGYKECFFKLKCSRQKTEVKKNIFRHRGWSFFNFWLCLEFIFIFPLGLSSPEESGGVTGYTVKIAMQMGFRRSLLTNEAGLGSVPIAHAAAQTKSHVHQRLMGVAEVFMDTIGVCSFTALINLSTGLWKTKKAADAIQGTAFSPLLLLLPKLACWAA